MKCDILHPVLKLGKFAMYGILIQCVGISLLFAAETNAQQIKSVRETYIEVGFKDASLKNIINRIEQLTDFKFVYQQKLLNDWNQQVNLTLPAGKKSVADVLLAVSKQARLKFKQTNNNININVKSAPSNKVESSLIVQIENTEVRGRIIDENDESLPGVNVVIEGTSAGTITDFDGNYFLEVPKGGSLVFSYVGYATQKVVVGNQTTIDIKLELSAEGLSELVITGYQTLSEERATGSFGVARAPELQNQNSTDLRTRLDGLIPGLLIDKQNDGTTKIQIRGQSTLFANQEPLVVVDGMPIEGGWDSIEPNDVESVTVLKDAAAASIWGTRAANGVIVIQTKSGRLGKKVSDLNFNYSITMGDAYDLSDLQLSGSPNLVDFEFDALLTDIYKERDVIQQHFAISPVFQILIDKPADMSQQLDALKKLDATRQLEELFMQQSMLNQFHVNYQLSNERNALYVALNGVATRGNMAGNSRSRINISIKEQFMIIPGLKLNVGINTTFNKAYLNGLSVGEIVNRKPYELIFDEQGNKLPQSYTWHQRYIDQFEPMGYLNWDYNLKTELDNRDHTTQGLENRMNIALDYTILDGLNVSTAFLYELSSFKNTNYQNQDSYYARNLINTFTIIDQSTGDLNHQFPMGGILTEIPGSLNSYTWRNIVNYNKELKGGDHIITALGGFEMREVIIQSHKDVYAGYNPQTDTHQEITLSGYEPSFQTNTAGENKLLLFNTLPFRPDSTHVQDRHLSYFFNAGYTYKNKYSFTTSARLDQTNLFGVAKRFRNNPLWSVGFKWNAVEEEILPDFFNRFDLRASYGFNGNVDRRAKSFATADYRANLYDEVYLSINEPKNDDLGFERTAVLNLGLDFAIWSNRFSGTFEYFIKQSSDVLGFIANDPTTGWGSVYANYADISNKGYEASFRVVVLAKNEFNWSIGFNYSNVENKVEYIDEPNSQARYYLNGGSGAARIGQPISSLYNFRSAGVGVDGDYLVYDAEGGIVVGQASNTLEFNDLVYSGQTDPTFFGGFFTDFSYKNFSFSARFSYKGGHVARMPMPDYGRAASTANTNEGIVHAWRSFGDEFISGVLPGVMGPESLQPLWRQGAFRNDVQVIDASSLRLRNIELAYNASFGKKPVNVQFFTEFKNMVVWTKNDLGIDPDFINPYSGALRLTEPRNYLFGVKVNLL